MGWIVIAPWLADQARSFRDPLRIFLILRNCCSVGQNRRMMASSQNVGQGEPLPLFRIDILALHAASRASCLLACSTR